MPTQIIDNFDLNSPKPIDNRFVVGSQSFYVNKDLIPFKYPGMRVWDLNQGVYGVPYVWTGTTFSNESSSGVSGGGSVGYIPGYTGVSTLGNSLIYQSGTQLNINNSTSFTPGYLLTIAGSVSVIGGAIAGNGRLLTSLDASQITSGFMSTARLSNPSTASWILTSGPGSNGNAQFTNPSLLTVGKAEELSVGRKILGITFSGSAPVSGAISSITTITFGNAPTNKLTLEYQASSAKTLRVPSLSNLISNIVVAEQSNTFGTIANPVDQTVNGTVIVNKDSGTVNISGIVSGETIKLIGNSTVYSNYYLNTSKVAQIGVSTTNFEMSNLNLGSLILKANTGTLVSPSLVNRLLVNSAGVRFGDNGTPMKSITTGTIRIFYNYTSNPPVVLRGTGFTTSPIVSSLPVITIRVTLTSPVSGNDMIIVASLDGDANYYKYKCVTEKISTTDFKISVAYDSGTGTWPSSFSLVNGGKVEVSFICITI